MAVVFNPAAGVDRTANGGYTVLPENVILKPEFNGRSEDTDVTELAEDIIHRKQLVPAICYKSPEGWPILVAGHRRLRAISLANKDLPEENKIRLKFNYADVKNEEQALDLTVAENRNRTDTNVMDDCYNINIYTERFGKGVEEIAKKYFPGANSPEKLAKAVSWVKERQKLTTLSPEAQEKLRKGEFSTTAATELTKLQPVEQDKVIKEAAAKGTKLRVADVKEAVENANPAKKRTIADNSPVKLLKKFKIFAEVASGLASEVLSKKPDADVVKELAQNIAVMCFKLGIPQLAATDKYASQNLGMRTFLDNLE